MSDFYILIYPQTLILYNSVKAATEGRTKAQKKFDMEVYRVEYIAFLPEEKETA